MDAFPTIAENHDRSAAAGLRAAMIRRMKANIAA
jgi:hypothetical protein